MGTAEIEAGYKTKRERRGGGMGGQADNIGFEVKFTVYEGYEM